MKKLIKIAGILLGLLLVLIIAVFLLASFLITPDRVRSTVLPMAEKTLNREVSLGDIEISLFSGIVIKDLVVRERDGTENFIAANEVELRYQFWPLFFREVVVDEVRLEGPRIRIVRESDGTFNFSDLLRKDREKEPAAPSEKQRESPPLNLFVSSLAVSEGRLFFLDHAAGSQPPFSYKLEDLSLEVSGLALDLSFPYKVSASLQGAPLMIKGKIDPLKQRGSAEVNLTGLPLTDFSPYFQEKVPGKLKSVRLGLDLKAEGDAKTITSRGSIALDEIDITLDTLEDAPIKEARLALEYDLSADLAASTLKLSRAAFDLNNIPVEASGEVRKYATEPQVDLNLNIPRVELPAILAAVPEGLANDAASLDPSGTVRAEVRLSGPISEPDKMLEKGMIELASVQAGKKNFRPELSGAIDLKGDMLVSRNMRMTMGENLADLKFEAANLFGKQIRIKSAVTSERFAVDPLLKALSAPGAAGKEKPGKAGEKKDREIGPFEIPLKADGKVLVATALYKGLTIRNFDLAYHLEDNILTVEHLKGQVAGGNFSKTARIDLGRKGLDYQAEVSVKAVDANPFVSAFLPKAKDTVFGELFFDLKAHGQGVHPETIKKSLSGQGQMRLLEGRITGAGLAEGLAGFLDLEKLRVLRFSRFKGEYTIDKGRLRVNTDFNGSDLKMQPTGTIGLDGTIDLSLGLRLSPEYAGILGDRGAITQFIKDEQGWARLPLDVGGSLTDPNFSLDTSAVRRQLQEKAGSEVRKKIQEEVLDKISPPDKESSAQEDPARKMLRETLEGILGN